MSTINSESLTICLARRLAIQYKEPQQAAIVQTAARMLTQSNDEQTKKTCLDLIAASPAERQRVVAFAENMFLAKD